MERGQPPLQAIGGGGHGRAQFRDLRLGARVRRRCGHASAVVAMDHRNHAAEQVAEVVGEIGIEPPDERLLAEARVLPQRHFGHQEIPERVHAVAVNHVHRIDHVAQRLAHLGLADEPPAVGEDRLRQRHAARVEHRGPVDRVRGEDILADQLHLRGPAAREVLLIAAIADGADVVHEGVEPDIADVLVVERQVNAPRQAAFRAGNAKVLERLAQEAQRLVAAEVGLDELGVRLDVADQPFLIAAHPEEIVGLANALHGTSARRAVPLDEVLFREIAFVADAVPSVVFRRVDLPAVVEILQHPLHDGLVAGFGGADEIVVGDAQALPQLLEADDGGVGLFLRRVAGLLRGLLHLLSVLIGAGQEPRIMPHQPVIPRQHIREDRGVGVADVGTVIDVVDRRRDVERGAHRAGRLFQSSPRPLFKSNAGS